jgi:hypothetical protein
MNRSAIALRGPGNFLQSRCGPDWIESQDHSSLDGCEKASDWIESAIDFQGRLKR